MKSSAQHETVQTEKSGEEVAKQKFARNDLRYWQAKVFKQGFTRDGEQGEVADWNCRMQFKGRREQFNLHTSNRAAAAARAKAIWEELVANGWNAVLEKHKPRMQTKAVATVGDLIGELRGHWAGKPKTFADYAKSFRRIVAQAFGIEAGREKFDYVNGGRAAWIAKIDRVKLADVTPDKVNKWRIAFVKKAGDNPVLQRRARISCNSLLRQAKSLFAPELIRHVRLDMPGKLPFEGVAFYERESMRYRSAVDIETLIGDAMRELSQEQLKIFLLATMAGLRKSEIDKLEWASFRWTEGVIRIEATEHFTPKTSDSAGDVPVEPEMAALFRGWRAKASGAFVIEADAMPRTATNYTHYRAQAHFDALLAWLRAKGVTATKPLHELRKEFGSQICAKAGIYAASRMLRHADIAITALHYLDQKERVTVGLGALLARPENVTPIEQPQEVTEDKPRREKAV